MNLKNKKELAKKVLGVGKNRIIFSPEGMSEIKEAITKQDIQTLYQEGIIKIKPVKGRKTQTKRKTKRGPGKIRKTIKKRKQVYVKLTRKLRGYVKGLKNQGTIENETYMDLRKKIKMKYFKSKAHLKEYLSNETKMKIREPREGKQEKTQKAKTRTKKKIKEGKE